MLPETATLYPSRLWDSNKKEFFSNPNMEQSSENWTTVAVKKNNEVLGFPDGTSVDEMEQAIHGDQNGTISEHKPRFYEKYIQQPLAGLGIDMFQPKFITDIKPTPERAFVTSFARGATADIFKPPSSDQEAAAYPGQAFAGSLAGSIVGLKGAGLALQGIKLPTFAKYAKTVLDRTGLSKLGEFASKALPGAIVKKAIPAAIESAKAAGAYRAVSETANEIRDADHPDLAKIGNGVLHDALWWGGIGGTIGPLTKFTGVAASTGLGYLMAKVDGASEPDALLNGAVLGGFHLVSSHGDKPEVRKFAKEKIEANIADYIQAKNPMVDEQVAVQAARELVRMKAEEVVNQPKQENVGIPGENQTQSPDIKLEAKAAIDEVLKSQELTQKMVENIGNDIFDVKPSEGDVPRANIDAIPDIKSQEQLPEGVTQDRRKSEMPSTQDTPKRRLKDWTKIVDQFSTPEGQFKAIDKLPVSDTIKGRLVSHYENKAKIKLQEKNQKNNQISNGIPEAVLTNNEAARKYGESIKGDASKIEAFKAKRDEIQSQIDELYKIDNRTDEQDNQALQLAQTKGFLNEGIKIAEGIDKITDKTTGVHAKEIPADLKSLAEEAKKYKTAEEFVASKKVYRGGGAGELLKGKTAKDIIDYETKELGNKIEIKQGIDLSKIKSENVRWLTRDKASAKEYGKALEATGGEVFATDNYGGMLVDISKAKTEQQLTDLWNQVHGKDQGFGTKALMPGTSGRNLINLAKEKIKNIDEKNILEYANKIAKFEKKKTLGPTDIAEAIQYASPDKNWINTISIHRLFDSKVMKSPILERLNDVGLKNLVDRHFEKSIDYVKNALVDMPIKAKEILKKYIENDVPMTEGHWNNKFNEPIDAGRLHKYESILREYFQNKTEDPPAVKMMEILRRKISSESGAMTIPEISESGTESIYQKTFNRFQSIENTVQKAKELGAVILPGEDAGLSAAKYLSNANQADNALRQGTFRITPEGKVEVTGEGLKSILDEFDKSIPEKDAEIRHQDLKEYLIARRTIEDLQRPKADYTTENIVTPEQVAKAQSKLGELTGIYGKNFKIFEGTAKRIYDFQKRVLHSLVDSGNMSEDQFAQIISTNPHYIPFDRILPEEAPQGGTPINKNRFSGAKSPVKKIKGSDLEIHDPIESIIKNTYKIMDTAARNKVFKDIHSLKDLEELGISKKEIQMIPIAKIEHRAVIDKKFIDDLAGFAKTLGADFKTTGQPGRAAGYYYPGEKLITRKFATPREVMAHETAHFFDAKFALKQRFYKRGITKPIAEEMIGLMKRMGESQNRINKTEERFADSFSWWLTNRDLAKQEIPLFSKAIENIIGSIPELKPVLDIKPSPEISLERMQETIFGQSQFKPKGNVVEGWIDGKRTYLEVSKNLYEAMTGLDEQSSGILVKILSQPAHWLRTGATITPEFILRNPLRDQWTALLQTHVGFRPFIDPIGAISDIIGKKEIYNDWIRSGGSYSGFVELSRPALKKMVGELVKDKTLMSRLNIVHTLGDLSQLFEQATRLGVYKAAIRSGLPPVDAAKQSRESTVDFARRGSKTKEINSVVAFFNAGLQGLDKSIRTVVNDPGGLTIKALATITIPSVLLYLKNRQDEDYQEIPRWQRDLFWMTKINNAWVRVPKPFLYGQIFGSLPERFLEYLDTKDSGAFNKLTDSLYNALSPISGDPVEGFLPTAIKPLIENETNWSFFRQRPIVSEGKKHLIPSQQSSAYDTETAKILGAIFNTSPSKIENLAQGYFGGSGRYALQGGDQLINLFNKAEGKGKKPTELSDVPLIKGFVSRNPLEGAESLQKFYDSREKINALSSTHNLFKKNGEKEKANRLKAQHPELEYAKDSNRAADDISNINKKIEEISKSKNLSDDIKREKLQKLLEERLAIAKKFNKKISNKKGE